MTGGHALLFIYLFGWGYAYRDLGRNKQMPRWARLLTAMWWPLMWLSEIMDGTN